MSKPLQWFRLYSEIVDDAKLLLLSPADRWFYVAILACKAQGLLDGEDAERRRKVVEIKLRLTPAELDETARRLAESGLISAETLQPLTWDKRQFKSDHDDRDSSERVRVWREKNRNQTVTAVTPPHVTRLKPRTETETETEKDLSLSKDNDCLPQAEKTPVDRPPRCPIDELISEFHDACPSLPQVRVMTPARKAIISQRWKDVWADVRFSREDGLIWFRSFFDRVNRSKFLSGKATNWKADLPWLMKQENFAKVCEGRYDQ